jgi:hypothetical protein
MDRPDQSVHSNVSFQRVGSVISVSRMNKVIVSSGVGLFALVAGISSAAAQAPQASALPPPAPALGEPTPTVASTPVASTPAAGAPTMSADGGATPAPDSKAKKPRMFGAMFDIGVPDGTTLSAVFRPIDLARLHAGVGYNGVSPGLRIGGEFLPLGWGPSLGIAYGHFFEGDASGVAGMFGKIDDDTSKLLENVGYSYFALRAGMELGGDRFTFFGRGGVTWISTTIHELDALIEPDPASNTTVTVVQDPVLNAFVPTLQFGMIVQI